MSHDLQFTIENGDESHRPEVPIAGEMDHLPDRAGIAQSATPSTLQFVAQKLSQSAHPVVIIFHCLFKAAALFLYIFGGWFVKGGSSKSAAGANFIAVTVVCILLLAADFWVVKNVTGRLLVGLRWWNKVENDSTTWIFESAENQVVNNFDRNVFWTVLYATPAMWMVMLFFGVLKLELGWLIIVVMALALSLANVYGYYRCSTAQQARFQQMMQQGAQQGALAVMRSGLLGMMTQAAATVAGAPAPNQNPNAQRSSTTFV